MPRVTVVTGWNPAGYELYGKQFVDTFDRHWPADIRLYCYVEKSFGAARRLSRRLIVEYPLSRCAGVMDFIGRHSGTPERCGRLPNAAWKARDRAAGYNFRFDAVKFSRQMFIPENVAAEMADGDILVWLDADVITFADVPADLVSSLMGEADLCYLGREKTHSEIGFWAVRLTPATRSFLEGMADEFRQDTVFKLPEWHSAFVFDHMRRCFEEAGGIAKNLTPKGRGHVWFQSRLGDYTDHLKGDRKKSGRSMERA